MKRVLSCIQPTGSMHYGNYLGAVKNWVDLQEKYTCVYGVVDYHAMTAPYKPDKLRQNTWEIIFNLLAVGVKPEHLFIQSLIPEHAELGWIFNCFCSYGRLTRMTQFKDKSTGTGQGDDGFISAGLLDYPVLQAADILIYRADYVPVGKDQQQHLELTREIAERFNNQVGKPYFALPEILFTESPKILSTADPSKKMSKSAGEKHNISVFEEEAVIRRKIKSAVTDAGDTPSGEMSAGIENLFTLLKGAGGLEAHASLMEDFNNDALKYVDLKNATADALVAMTNKFAEQKKLIKDDKRRYKDMIKASSADIRKRAQETVREVKELAGLSNVKY